VDAAQGHFRLGTTTAVMPVEKGSSEIRFDKILLKSGPGRLEAWVESGGKTIGVHYVDVKRL